MRDSRAAPSRSKSSIRPNRQEALVRQRYEAALRIAREQRHDAVDVRDRQVRRDKAADEPVHRGVAADTERDREHQGETQAPLTAEASEGMSKIVHRAPL